jgi:hypothetical protein
VFEIPVRHKPGEHQENDPAANQQHQHRGTPGIVCKCNNYLFEDFQSNRAFVRFF